MYLSDRPVRSRVRPMGLTLRKQPSGGRGEYELVGSSGQYNASNFDEYGFLLQTPYGVKQTEVILSHQGRKRRLRLTASVPHLQRQMAALAMLPPSTRDENAVSDALPVVIAKRYILDVDLSLVSVDLLGGMVTVKPKAYQARSGTFTDAHHKETIPAKERFALLKSVYSKAQRLPPDVAGAVAVHESLVKTSIVIGASVEKAVKSVMESVEQADIPGYLPDSDPLPALAAFLGVTDQVELPLPTETPADTPEIRVRAESYYRLMRSRGPGAASFRKKVHAAYDSRCAFCGFRAPPIKGLAKAGVDAAHILPYGEFDLDVVTNAMALCKQHHWAFDNRVLILGVSGDAYDLSLNPEWVSRAGQDQKTVSELERVVGPIPEANLPAKGKRPHHEYIAALYS